MICALLADIKNRDSHQSSENRKGRRGTLAAMLDMAQSAGGARYTAEQCNEETGDRDLKV